MCLLKKARDSSYTLRVQFSRAWSVHLMGEFNGWSTSATPLTQIDVDTWEAPLPPGTENERFLYFVHSRGRRYGHVLADSVEG